MKVSELKGAKLEEWRRFLELYRQGKLNHHTRGFMHKHACARLGLTITVDRFGRHLKKAKEAINAQ
jgi:hypothetical protein